MRAISVSGERPEVAECIWAPQWVDDDITGLPVCAGLADEADLSRDESNRARRAEARVATRRLVRELELPIRLSELERENSPRQPEVTAGVGLPASANGNGNSIGNGMGGEDIRRQVEQLADSDPDRVAQQLRTWMQEG